MMFPAVKDKDQTHFPFEIVYKAIDNYIYVYLGNMQMTLIIDKHTLFTSNPCKVRYKRNRCLSYIPFSRDMTLAPL